VNHQLWPGGGAVITAGMMQGVFAVPMKFTSRWNYENIWLVYSLTGMIGRLLTFARMDDAILGSIDIALRKAKTSVLFNNPSESLWEYCKPGDPAPATEYTNGGLIPYAGGVLIRAVDGSLIGAIGVSDGMPLQDGEVASSTAHFRILQDPFQARLNSRVIYRRFRDGKRKSGIERVCGCSRDQTATPGEQLAGATGLEPAASCVTGRRSNQLNYAPAYIAPLLPDCSFPFPPLPTCVQNCPRVP
jgi:uncharacterized protein GlcG (DUF336 family)